MIWSFWDALWGMVATFFFAFPFGYLVTSYIEDVKSSSDNFFVTLPVYIAMGLACWGPLLFFLSLLHIDRNIVLIAWAVSIAIVLYKKVGKPRKLTAIKNRFHEPHLALTNVIIPTLLFALSLLVYARFAYLMQWSPPGDTAKHTVIMSIIIDQGKFPIDESTGIRSIGISTTTTSYGYLQYPDFEVLSACISMVMSIYPGQSALILAACISTLIPLLIYATVYKETKSHFFSVLAFLMVYAIPPGFWCNPLHHILNSNLLNGTYPCHYGNLTLILLFYLVVCGRLNRFSFLALAVSTLFNYVYYFPLCLAILFLSFSISSFLKSNHKKVSIQNIFSKIIRDNITSVTLVIIVAFIVIVSGRLWSIIEFLRDTYLEVYAMPLEKLLMLKFPNILFILAPIFFVFIPAVWRKKPRMAILHFCISLLFLFSLNNWFFDHLLFWVGPIRTFPTFVAWSHIVFGVSLSLLLKKTPMNLSRSVGRLRLSIIFKRKRRSIPFVRTASYLLLFVLFVSIFETYFTYKPSTWGRPIGTDYLALKWISENVPKEDLILNDNSWTGRYLVSFSAKKVVNFSWFGWRDPEHGKLMYECNQIFDKPGDYDLIRDTIQKWSIKYIFISHDDCYESLIYVPCEGGYLVEYGQHRWRPWDRPEYVGFFDNNPYLRIVFRAGYSAVYKTFLD